MLSHQLYNSIKGTATIKIIVAIIYTTMSPFDIFISTYLCFYHLCPFIFISYSKLLFLQPFDKLVEIRQQRLVLNPAELLVFT